METAGIRRKAWKCMSRRRRYFNSKKSPPADFWWVFIILLSIVAVLMPITLKYSIAFTFTLSIFGVLFVIGGILTVKHFGNRQKVYIVPKMSKMAEKRAKHVKKRFTASILAEFLKMGVSTRYGTALPSVSLWIADDLDTGSVYIENLGVYGKLENSQVLPSLSGILPRPYEVVASEMVKGGAFVRFAFEDAETSHRFIVKNNDLRPFVSSDVHSLRLANDLVWNLRKVPHASIIGRTGSGKTMFTGGYLAKLASLQGWEVIYASAKPDRFTKKFDGPTKPEQITIKAEQLVEIMQERLTQIQAVGVDDYGDIEGMNDIVFFIDEIGHLNALLSDDKKLKARFESALKSLSFTGRSAGIHLIGVSQYATIEAFLPSSVRGNMKDCVIMLGGSASSGEERKFLIPGFSDLPQRSYQQGEGIALVLCAGNKWTTPHFYETPLFEFSTN